MIFASEVLRSFLRRKQIATLEELKQMLGTASTMTVFRKLKKAGLSHQLFPPRQVLYLGGDPSVR